ncbi:MAG TPA: rhomboid family intramembrane serine protease [Phycisphaerae bacterium]|nr:rhomboid family intramembrane serine protease [Phycisphaerae bacterium]
MHIGKPAACPNCHQRVRMVAAHRLDNVTSRSAFLIESGPQRVGELIFLLGDQTISVGKSADANLSFRSADVSRVHCYLRAGSHGWRIEDNDSTNGLFVNGRRVNGHNLLNGDSVGVGAFVLRYMSDIPAATLTESEQRVATEMSGDSSGGHMIELVGAAAATADVGHADSAGDDSDGSGLLNLLSDDIFVDEGKTIDVPAPPSSNTQDKDGPTCPSCKRQLPARAKICVRCGINVETGRQIITSQDTNLNEIYGIAEKTIWWISWVSWLGVYPIASEAFGLKKPIVIRTIAVVTILISGWFLWLELSFSDSMIRHKNLMLWSGDGEIDPDTLVAYYYGTSWGDTEAFDNQLELSADSDLNEDERILAAHNAIPKDRQAIGQFRASQLVTHAFLHGGIFHLLGNLLFLMVFGSRVNALIGPLLTVIVYPVLAIGAGLAHAMSCADQMASPMLGASGAIMGLAGMYFVFFPAHNVHVAAWWRWGIIRWFELSMTIFTVRGFWVVLFYIAFDVAFTIIGAEDGVAHWAHLGGFIVGIAVGVILLLARLVNARGGDLISVILGRRAWALLGRPGYAGDDE